VRDLHLVDRIGHLVLDRLERAQIGDDAVEVTRRENLIESGRHDFGEPHAVRADALLQRGLDLRVGPIADAGLLVGRDVGRGDVERRFVETQAPRQRLVELRAVRSHRRVAVVAGHHRIDQLLAALDRRLRRDRHGGCQHGSDCA
jgi:hypothetical protein